METWKTIEMEGTDQDFLRAFAGSQYKIMPINQDILDDNFNFNTRYNDTVEIIKLSGIELGYKLGDEVSIPELFNDNLQQLPLPTALVLACELTNQDPGILVVCTAGMKTFPDEMVILELMNLRLPKMEDKKTLIHRDLRSKVFVDEQTHFLFRKNF